MASVLGTFWIRAAYAQGGALPVPSDVQLWHFSDDDVQEYSNGRQVYFKVTYRGVEVLWDPVNQLLTKWADSYTSKIKTVPNYDSLVRQEPLQLDPDTTIEHYIPSPVGGTSFTDYYHIASSDQFNGDFFLVGGEGRGHIDQRFCCDDPNHAIDSFVQRYDTIVYVQAIKISRKRLLLVVASFDASYRVQIHFIGMLALPQQALGFDQNVFLIPTSLINPALQAAGPALRARYAVVTRLIAAATEVKPSEPGQMVSAEEFFSGSP